MRLPFLSCLASSLNSTVSSNRKLVPGFTVISREGLNKTSHFQKEMSAGAAQSAQGEVKETQVLCLLCM